MVIGRKIILRPNIQEFKYDRFQRVFAASCRFFVMVSEENTVRRAHKFVIGIYIKNIYNSPSLLYKYDKSYGVCGLNNRYG